MTQEPERLLLTLRRFHTEQSLEYPLDADYSLDDLQQEINQAIDDSTYVELLLDRAFAAAHQIDPVVRITPLDFEVISVSAGDLRRSRPCP